MRLLFLNYEFPPIGGGGGNAASALINEYKNYSELYIDVVTSAFGSKIQKEQLSDNIFLYRLPVGKKDIHYWRQIEIVRSIYSTWKFCKKRGYDLCHAFFGIPGGINACFLDVPYIVSLRGSDVPGFNPRFAFQYPVLKPVCRGVWRKARKVIANSEGLKNLAFRTAPNQDIGIIPNGIDIEQFKPGERNNNQRLRILTVSRLIGRKDIGTLLEAVEKTGDIDLTLDIIGEGNLLDNLKDRVSELRINDKVNFHGYIAHNELPDYYRKADIFILPSLWEGMSNTLLEGMASGLPVIVTDTGGTRELFRDNGIIVPMKDPESLAKAIKKLAKSPEERISMGKKSREIAEKFSWKESAKNYFQIYQEVLNQKQCKGAKDE